MTPTMRRTITIQMMSIIVLISTVTAFMPYQPLTRTTPANQSPLYMVLEKPRVKEIAKIEQLKVDSNYLIRPLLEVTFLVMIVVVVAAVPLHRSCYIYFDRSDEYRFFPRLTDKCRRNQKGSLSHKPVDILWSSTLIGSKYLKG